MIVPYLTAGWPSEEGFLAAVSGAARAGCPMFEVGIPFSDPVADGPVIQRTSTEALERGVTVDRALWLARQAVERSGLPAVAMTYANLVFHRGVARFCQDLADAGCQALIVPDLPLEEAAELEQTGRESGIDLIYLATPTTSEARMAELGRHTRRFLYLVSVRGVTGSRAELPGELDQLIARAVRASQAPVYVGFGVSTRAHAARILRTAQGVIVGSALLERLENGDPGRAAEEFLRSLMPEDAC
ncbi:MAG: tryptophan synthase subunit alpha [Candidatus Eremiobacterota bacterium]